LQVIAELIEALNLRRLVLVGQGDGGRLGLAAAQALPERFAGAWLIDTWPLNTQPSSVSNGLNRLRASRLGCGQGHGRIGREQQCRRGRAWNAPFAQPGHRAALKAWPRLQTELAAPPADLLQQWAQAGRLWLQPAATQQPVSAAQWQAAWLQAVPQLAAQAGVWRQTRPGAPVPAAQQGGGAAAVEYFAP
jgi:tRNA(adenine34) deaminase